MDEWTPMVDMLEHVVLMLVGFGLVAKTRLSPSSLLNCNARMAPRGCWGKKTKNPNPTEHCRQRKQESKIDFLRGGNWWDMRNNIENR